MSKLKITLEELTKVRTAVYQATGDTIAELWNRWQDEKEYEDFADYQKVLKNRFEKANVENATFIKATKRPFGIQYLINDVQTVQLFVKRKGNNLVFTTIIS